MKVLIIKLSALGDVIHAIPAMNAIKAAHPDWQIDWLINDSFKALIAEQPSLGKVYTLRDKRLISYFEVIQELRKEDYDLVIDLQGLLKTALVSFFVGSNKTKVIGFENPRENIATCFYTEKVTTENNHVIEQNLAIAKHLGAKLEQDSHENYLVDYGGLMPSTASVGDNASSLQICLIPSTTWKSKLWLASSWAELIKSLIQDLAADVFVLGTSFDDEAIDEIYQHLDSELKTSSKLSNLIDKTSLADLPNLFRKMDLVIGVDTGPLHLAAASIDSAKTKILGLYGPTSASRTGPYGYFALSFYEMIGRKASHKRNERENYSMSLIPADEVFEISRALLAQ